MGWGFHCACAIVHVTVLLHSSLYTTVQQYREPVILFFQLRIRSRIRILPSTSKTKKKNLEFYCFVTFLLFFFSLKNDVNVRNKRTNLERKKEILLASWFSLTKLSGSVSQRYGSEDPDPQARCVTVERYGKLKVTSANGSLCPYSSSKQSFQKNKFTNRRIDFCFVFYK